MFNPFKNESKPAQKTQGERETEERNGYLRHRKAIIALFPEIEGCLLNQFLVQIVEPEFNVAYLVMGTAVYAIQGYIGGEMLEIVKTDKNDIKHGDHLVVKSFPPFSKFENHRISQIREIGDVWNGHGYELSFSGISDKTMIIQSIYSGEKEADLEDCLRLGVGKYYLRSDDSITPHL